LAKNIDDHVSVLNSASEDDAFSLSAKTGWHRFSKFLLINVVAIVSALLLIGAFTVWS